MRSLHPSTISMNTINPSPNINDSNRSSKNQPPSIRIHIMIDEIRVDAICLV